MTVKITLIILIFFSCLILINIHLYAKPRTLQRLESSNIPGAMMKQVWQIGPNDVTPAIQQVIDEWRAVPNWEYHFVDDDDIITHLTAKFREIDIDELVNQHRALALDLFRYSIMFERGGLYADPGVAKAPAFDRALRYLGSCNVIVGIELDARHAANVTRSWSFYAVPNHRLVKLMLDRVIRVIQYHQVRDFDLRESQVMELTGPGLWTDSIVDYLMVTGQIAIEDLFACGGFYVVNDVCILDIRALALPQAHTCDSPKPAA